MTQLVSAWTNVSRGDKYEFKLRVAKRKEAVQGASAATAGQQEKNSTSATSTQPQATGIAEGGAQQQPMNTPSGSSSQV